MTFCLWVTCTCIAWSPSINRLGNLTWANFTFVALKEQYFFLFDFGWNWFMYTDECRIRHGLDDKQTRFGCAFKALCAHSLKLRKREKFEFPEITWMVRGFSMVLVINSNLPLFLSSLINILITVINYQVVNWIAHGWFCKSRRNCLWRIPVSWSNCKSGDGVITDSWCDLESEIAQSICAVLNSLKTNFFKRLSSTVLS